MMSQNPGAFRCAVETSSLSHTTPAAYFPAGAGQFNEVDLPCGSVDNYDSNNCDGPGPFP